MLLITPEILYNLLTCPVLSHHCAWETHHLLATIRSLYKVLFFSMLRSSNLVPTSHNKVDPLRQFTWGVLRRYPDGTVLTVMLSKTIQFRE